VQCCRARTRSQLELVEVSEDRRLSRNKELEYTGHSRLLLLVQLVALRTRSAEAIVDTASFGMGTGKGWPAGRSLVHIRNRRGVQTRTTRAHTGCVTKFRNLLSANDAVVTAGAVVLVG
jgi:hypothetical protein